jgi:cytochrome P450 family 142 subfamily A polypeptide 1
MVIGRLLGFDDDLWPRVKHWSEATIVAGGGPRYMNDGVAEAFGDYCEHAARLMEARQSTPADDVMTVWMEAEGAGVLTGDQVLSEGLLLVDGGAETTRTVITGALLALIEHPDQHRRLLEEPELLPVAVEEFIRWVTPILNMRRTATRDAEVAGTPVQEGDELLLMYASANRDEAVFDEPHRFDVGRQPNPHVAFGFGTHLCLGAAHARLIVRTLLKLLSERVDRIEILQMERNQPSVSEYLRQVGFRNLTVRFQQILHTSGTDKS